MGLENKGSVLQESLYLLQRERVVRADSKCKYRGARVELSETGPG